MESHRAPQLAGNPGRATFSPHQRLISATDTASLITYCNPEFAAISGYSEAELIGSPHNLVRHPDMPMRRCTS